MAQLPPVPLRVPVIEGGYISRDMAVYLRTVAQQVNTLTPAGTYANNVDALAAGLLVGQVYQTATGELRVVV